VITPEAGNRSIDAKKMVLARQEKKITAQPLIICTQQSKRKTQITRKGHGFAQIAIFAVILNAILAQSKS
jgi:hypothetical protein